MGLEHDPDRVTRLAGEARRRLDTLREMGKLPREDFLGDADKVGHAKYALVVAIEASVDLANHVISRNGFRMPDSYADAFHVLAEGDVIAGDLADDLASMARFRNRLIHIYDDIDDALVHGFLQEDLVDVDSFLETLLDSLE